MLLATEVKGMSEINSVKLVSLSRINSFDVNDMLLLSKVLETHYRFNLKYSVFFLL